MEEPISAKTTAQQSKGPSWPILWCCPSSLGCCDATCAIGVLNCLSSCRCLSCRLGIPALVLFLGIGMLAGSDGPGGIYFDDALLAQSVGVVALAFILFAGGLETEWHIVRPALAGALSLSTIGVLLTAVIVAVFALLVLHVSFLEGLLLGAIISATDAAAVFSVLVQSHQR